MRFADVLEIKNGKNQKAVENPNGKYPIYGSGGVMGYADDYICEGQTVVIGRKGSINNPLFVDEPFWNVDTAFGLCADTKVLLPMYLFYFCKRFNFESLNKTVTIPSLTKSDLLKIEISLPSLEKQAEIVETLSTITLIIELRKHELRSLDNLIKARFVEMFGTVSNNQYGFEVKPLSEVASEFFAGGDKPSDCSSIQDEDHPYPVYANGFENSGLQGYSSVCRVRNSAVTVSARGTIGYCFVRDAGFTPVVRLITIVPKSEVSVEYLKYAINAMAIKTSGTSQAQLTVPEFKKELIVVPPTSQQQAFSCFVKQIDKSKFVVQQALEKAQLLLDSLMQKYFG